MKPSNIQAFIAELSGGVHEEMLCTLLSEVATSVHENNGTGEISIKLKFKPAAMPHPSGPTIECAHTVSYKRPKMRGSISEDDIASTPFHINKDGTVTLFPKDQNDMFNSATQKEKER